ncbi:MAG: hypothetical protein Q9223_005902 [Gallowayella weberi]
MSTQITIPSDYSYVLLTASLSTLVGYYHMYHTGKYRRAANVPYPNAYATAAEMKESKDKYLFNCAQRSHVTFLEVLTTLLVSGLTFPLFSAAAGVVWIAGRVAYLRGYTDPNKEQGDGRRRGNFGYFGSLALLGGSFVSAISLTGLGDKAMELLK